MHLPPLTSSTSTSTITNKRTKLLNKVKRTLSKSTNKPSSAYQSYLDSYSNGEIDLENPPLPPPLSTLDLDNHLNPTHHFFSAPLPQSESSRQKILNRLAYHQSPITSSSTSTSDSFNLSPTNTTFSSSSLSSPSTSHSHASFAYLQDLYLRPRLNSNNTTTTTTTDLNNSISKPIENRLSFSLVDHPDLHALVERCRALFSVTASMVSILDDDRNVYLAENGLNGITSVRRDLSFCSHTILNGDRVFAVLDTSVDWRFKNPPTSEHQATRFYAGAPIFAPHFPGLIDSPPSNPSCIGTICVVDTKPRKDFTIQERESLTKFANESQLVISNWFLEKINQKIKRLDSINLSNWVHHSSHSTKQSNQNELIPISTNLLNLEEKDKEENPKRIPSIDQTNSSTKSIGGFPFLNNSSSTTSSSIYKTFRNKKSNSSTIQSNANSIQDSINQERLNKKPYESPSPSQIAKFDLATKILAETLELSMVYLVAVLPTNKLIHLNSNEKDPYEILIISSHNVPTPAPILDYDLHLESIRKGSQGLIFNQLPKHNPLPSIHETTKRLKTDDKGLKEEEEWNEVQTFAYDRKFEICLRERRRLKSIKENGLNKSGILLLIGEEKEMKMFRVSDEVRKRKTHLGLRLDLDLDLKKEDIPKEEEEIEELEEDQDGDGERVEEDSEEEDGEESDREIKGGFLIEGYSLDPKRVLGLEDLVYFQHFSNELEKDLNTLYDSHCF